MDLDIFKSDKRTIDVQKIVFRLWENRRNHEKIKALCDILCKYADEKAVFREIEFYIPQLAHLIIHMDVSNRNQALEMVAMVLSQNSVHAAMQLNFLFNASMEDYQPEMANGTKNTACNPFYFSRCARLVQDVERAVIYGSREMANNSEGKIKPNDDKLDQIQRSLGSDKSMQFDGELSGQLYYKRVERKSLLHSKPWKLRYFVVDQRVLLCYKEPHAVNPKRAISLQNCRVVACDPSLKYGDTLFEVVNEANSTRYLLRAASSQARGKWVRFLEDEISGAPPTKEGDDTGDGGGDSDGEDVVLPPPSPGNSGVGNRRGRPPLDESDMTPAQRKRFAFFRQMRIFVANLTYICERLRHKERSVRKFFLERDLEHLTIPPFVYLPLSGSTDEYAVLRRSLPKEAVAFTTKARVPALMLFEEEVHPAKLDLSTFLGVELEKYSESEVVMSKVALVYGHSSTIQSMSQDACDASGGPTDGPDAVCGTGGSADRPRSMSLPRDVHSRFILYNTKNYEFWAPEGKGWDRVNTGSGAAGNSLPTPPGKVGSMSIVHADENKEPSTTASTTSTTAPHPPAPPASCPWGESFQEKVGRLTAQSPYASLPGYRVRGLIAKSNDDVRQEVFVMQLIQYYKKVFADGGVNVYLHTYRIMSTSKTTGLIELITDATSLDGLKKKESYPGSLADWYKSVYQGDRYSQAMERYVGSMAGYSIVCYLLGIKDRHNGNIMVDAQGSIIHIDFGFVFGLAPGKSFSMEKAPWKLTKELADVMGGVGSPLYEDYRQRCIQAFGIARKHAKQVSELMEVMQYQSSFPCFRYNNRAIPDFMSRLYLDYPDQDVPRIVDRLLKRSYNHSGTDLYDSFQLATNGIAK